MEHSNPDDSQDLQPTRYDNDVTLLYKFVGISNLPTNLIISRPRINNEPGFGSTKLIFESITDIIQRLVDENHNPADIYDIVTSFKPTISLNDIIMTWFGLYQDPERTDNYQDINELYQQIDESISVEQFEDENQLISSYNSWRNNIGIQTEFDYKRLNKILDNQQQLQNVGDVVDIPYSPVTISSTTTAYNPQIMGKNVTVDDGLDIFNYSIASVYAPFIKYVDNFGMTYYKVYNGGKIDTEPNYELTVIKHEKSNRPNTIYITLWLGDYNSDGSAQIRDAAKESFFIVIYNLENNYLTVEAPIGANTKKGLVREKQVAITRAQNAMPSINFGHGNETRVKGDFNLWNVELDECSFLHAILNDPVLNVYLYVEETITPFAFKERLNIHFRSIFSDIREAETSTEYANIANYASVSITINNKVAAITENKQIIVNGQTELYQITAGTPYLSISVSKATSREALDDFMSLFQLLIAYYLQQKDVIMQIYDFVFPDLRDELQVLLNGKKNKTLKLPANYEKNKKIVKTGDKRIIELREQAPDLFITNYPRKCQSTYQPVIVAPEDAEEFQNRRFGPNNSRRQLMPFPHGAPKFLFGCPGDDFPYPGVKLNNLDNKDIYPYIPCCFVKDVMTPGVRSKYRDYVQGVRIEGNRGAKADKKISTNKVLQTEKVAFLPSTIEEIVKTYSPDYVDMVRYGVPITTNSFLHCVCMAVDDPYYYSIPTEKLQEEYVQDLRTFIANNIEKSLVKQEMFDYTDDEIDNVMRDNNVFYDPSLFYRAVEEIFKINIYVFTPTEGDNQGMIDIPRFKIFHSRPERSYRPTVVIIKTMGSESNGLEYPQCELIVDYDKTRHEIVKLFGPSMTKICHTSIVNVMKTLSWEPKENREFSVHANIYYHLDHPQIFQSPLVSQYIDNYGKMRALTVDLGAEGLFTIQTIPSQPENIPHSDNIHRISYDLAVQMMGEPVACTRDIEDRVDGLWYSVLDLVYGEYVPIYPEYMEVNLPMGPLNPLVPEGTNLTGRMSVLRRTLNIITQLVKWFYTLSGSDNPKDFAKRYFVIDGEPVDDSAKYYDISGIERKLPLVNSLDDALEAIETIAPTLVQDGKIVMYNKIFSDRMIRMLTDYDNLRQGMIQKRKTHIDNYFETENDFIQNRGSKVFISNKDLDAWLLSLKSTKDYSKYYKINTTLNVNMGAMMDPIIYRHSDGTMYIIQNVVGGIYAKALAVAQTWKQFKVNVGSNVKPVEVTPPHIIYSISTTATFVPIQDHSNGTNNPLMILYYGSPSDITLQNGRFAAILRIL